MIREARMRKVNIPQINPLSFKPFSNLLFFVVSRGCVASINPVSESF